MSGARQADPVRQRVTYHGRVQGVFFRATAADLAQRFEVVGSVRNMPDGTVELEAEGPPEEVAAFLAAVAEHFVHNIAHQECSTLPPRGDETAFQVRY
jgi:acylphosphatase